MDFTRLIAVTRKRGIFDFEDCININKVIKNATDQYEKIDILLKVCELVADELYLHDLDANLDEIRRYLVSLMFLDESMSVTDLLRNIYNNSTLFNTYINIRVALHGQDKSSVILVVNTIVSKAQYVLERFKRMNNYITIHDGYVYLGR